MSNSDHDFDQAELQEWFEAIQQIYEKFNPLWQKTQTLVEDPPMNAPEPDPDLASFPIDNPLQYLDYLLELKAAIPALRKLLRNLSRANDYALQYRNHHRIKHGADCIKEDDENFSPQSLCVWCRFTLNDEHILEYLQWGEVIARSLEEAAIRSGWQPPAEQPTKKGKKKANNNESQQPPTISSNNSSYQNINNINQQGNNDPRAQFGMSNINNNNNLPPHNSNSLQNKSISPAATIVQQQQQQQPQLDSRTNSNNINNNSRSIHSNSLPGSRQQQQQQNMMSDDILNQSQKKNSGLSQQPSSASTTTMHSDQQSSGLPQIIQHQQPADHSKCEAQHRKYQNDILNLQQELQNAKDLQYRLDDQLKKAEHIVQLNQSTIQQERQMKEQIQTQLQTQLQTSQAECQQLKITVNGLQNELNTAQREIQNLQQQLQQQQQQDLAFYTNNNNKRQRLNDNGPVDPYDIYRDKSILAQLRKTYGYVPAASDKYSEAYYDEETNRILPVPTTQQYQIIDNGNKNASIMLVGDRQRYISHSKEFGRNPPDIRKVRVKKHDEVQAILKQYQPQPLLPPPNTNNNRGTIAPPGFGTTRTAGGNGGRIVNHGGGGEMNPAVRAAINHTNGVAPGAATNKDGTEVKTHIGPIQLNEDGTLPEGLEGLEIAHVETVLSDMMNQSTGITWEDIAGLKHCKNAIDESLVYPVLRPDLYTGVRQPPSGILLFGPPGTGKSLLGKAVANLCNARFFSVSASSLTSKWYGQGEKLVRTLFKVAHYLAPCVIFIDEVDSVLTSRTEGENDAGRRLKTELFVQMDGIKAAAQNGSNQAKVLVMGATNLPRELDDAARRRFVRRLYVPMPGFRARRDLLTRLLSKNAHTLTQDEIADVARLTRNYSAADINQIVAEASYVPLRAALKQTRNIKNVQVDMISKDHFIQALENVKPSVNLKSLQELYDFNEEYGSWKIPMEDEAEEDSDDEEEEQNDFTMGNGIML